MADPVNLKVERLVRELAALTADRPDLLAAIQEAAAREAPKPELDFLTIDEAAERMRVRPGTIRAWIRAGKLPAQRAGKRVLVRPADLAALLEPILPGGLFDDLDCDDDA